MGGKKWQSYRRDARSSPGNAADVAERGFTQVKTHFPADIIQARTIKTFSLQEAKVGELVQPYFEAANPTLGIYAKPDGIQVRLIAKGNNAVQLLDVAEKGIKEKLTPYVWGTDNDTLEGIVGQVLSRNNLTLATMEQFLSLIHI